MDSRDCTLIKDTGIDEAQTLSLRQPLETPLTIREKKASSRRHVIHRLRDLRKIPRKALKGQTFVSSPPDHGSDIEPLQFGQRVVLRSQVSLSISQFMEMHAIYKKDSSDATNILRAARHPYPGWYPMDRTAVRVVFEE